jgi:hypothetical protein
MPKFGSLVPDSLHQKRQCIESTSHPLDFGCNQTAAKFEELYLLPPLALAANGQPLLDRQPRVTQGSTFDIVAVQARLLHYVKLLHPSYTGMVLTDD